MATAVDLPMSVGACTALCGLRGHGADICEDSDFKSRT